MSILADHQVKKAIDTKEIIIDPYFDDLQGPNLYYCHLGSKFLIPKNTSEPIDPLKKRSSDIYTEVNSNEPITIPAKGFLLAETFEYFGSNNSHVIRLLNSSSLARVGIIHAAVGMINAGCGMEKPVKLTLELFNSSPFDIVLTPSYVREDGSIFWGTEVLKVAVETMNEATENPYDTWKFAIYSKDQSPSGSKMKQRSDLYSSKEYLLPQDSLHKK